MIEVAIPQRATAVNGRSRPGKSVRILQQEWPALYRVCVNTYFPRPEFGWVDPENRCDAGYILAGAVAAQAKCAELFAHRDLAKGQLDGALAGEVLYHARRAQAFKDPAAALYTCFVRLVVERPGKIWREYK